MWLIELVFPQFCKSDMSKYRNLEVFSESPLEFEITRVDCICTVRSCPCSVGDSIIK